MTSELWLVLTGQIITVLGLGGVLVWMGATIKAMKGTVDAQKETINAQSAKMDVLQSLVDTMQHVLTAGDVPRMTERFKAYKELVDQEKEVELRRRESSFDMEKRQLSEGNRRDFEDMETLASSLADVLATYLPYVPPDQRMKPIDEAKFPDRAVSLKNRLQRLAEKAPSAVESPGRGVWEEFSRLSIPEVGKRTRISQAKDGARLLASAVSVYAAHMGHLPASLGTLTEPATNAAGATAGSFVKAIPLPPPDWTPWNYSHDDATGKFSVTTIGDNTLVRLP